MESANEDLNATHLFEASNDGLNTPLWIQQETDRSAEWSNILSQFQMRYNGVHFAKESPCDCLETQTMDIYLQSVSSYFTLAAKEIKDCVSRVRNPFFVSCFGTLRKNIARRL